MPTSVVHFFRQRGVAATPGYSIFLTPWVGIKAATGFDTRFQTSAALGGGTWYNSGGAQNDEWTLDKWFDAGTYKAALLYYKASSQGIHSIQLDGVEQGQIDGYAAGASQNNYSEITGLSVTAGLKVIKDKIATKNASSSAYYGTSATLSWIRTGA